MKLWHLLIALALAALLGIGYLAGTGGSGRKIRVASTGAAVTTTSTAQLAESSTTPTTAAGAPPTTAKSVATTTRPRTSSTTPATNPTPTPTTSATPVPNRTTTTASNSSCNLSVEFPFPHPGDPQKVTVTGQARRGFTVDVVPRGGSGQQVHMSGNLDNGPWSGTFTVPSDEPVRTTYDVTANFPASGGYDATSCAGSFATR